MRRTFKQWLRDYLGITSLADEIAITNHLLGRIEPLPDLRPTLSGIARIIVKLLSEVTDQ